MDFENTKKIDTKHMDFKERELNVPATDKHYKIWIQIEEIDEENDKYTNITEPIDIDRFDTEQEAREAFQKIIDDYFKGD